MEKHQKLVNLKFDYLIVYLWFHVCEPLLVREPLGLLDDSVRSKQAALQRLWAVHQLLGAAHQLLAVVRFAKLSFVQLAVNGRRPSVERFLEAKMLHKKDNSSIYKF